MKRKCRLFIVVSLGIFTFILALLLSCSESKPPDRAKKIAEDIAPDFILKDVRGKTFSLSNHKGKPVLLIFITTWCTTCRAEIPHYKRIHETYHQRGLEVVNIDIQESREKIAQFVSKYEIPYTTLIDERGDVASAYNIIGVPSMVLVDKEGKIVSRQYLAMDSLLEMLVSKQ